MAMTGYGRPIVCSDRRVLAARCGLSWAYARPGGGPLLRKDISWRHISGVLINTPRGAVWLYFRRWGKG